MVSPEISKEKKTIFYVLHATNRVRELYGNVSETFYIVLIRVFFVSLFGFTTSCATHTAYRVMLFACAINIKRFR